MLKEIKYPFLYRHRDMTAATVRPSASIGWQTDQKSKPEMFSAIAAALRDDMLYVYDWVTYQELRTVEYRSGIRSAKIGAPHGMHDDHAMALGMALVVATDETLHLQGRSANVVEWNAAGKAAGGQEQLIALRPDEIGQPTFDRTMV